MKNTPRKNKQQPADIQPPTRNADELAQAWPEASYSVIPEAGHAVDNPAYIAALVGATERFKAVAAG